MKWIKTSCMWTNWTRQTSRRRCSKSLIIWTNNPLIKVFRPTMTEAHYSVLKVSLSNKANRSILRMLTSLEIMARIESRSKVWWIHQTHSQWWMKQLKTIDITKKINLLEIRVWSGEVTPSSSIVTRWPKILFPPLTWMETCLIRIWTHIVILIRTGRQILTHTMSTIRPIQSAD